MSEKVRIVIMCIASLLGMVYVVLIFMNKKRYEDILVLSRESEGGRYLTEVLMIGLNVLSVIERLGIKLNNSYTRRLHKIVADNRGSRKEGLYYKLMRARQVTILMLGILVLLISFAATCNFDLKICSILMLVEVGLLGVIIYENEFTETGRHRDRQKALMVQFPAVISKLTLLVSAGMPLRDAWKRVAMSGSGEIYREMQGVTLEMENGMSELEAYRLFGERCEEKEIRKFTSMLIQNMQKGSQELTRYMKEMSSEMWSVRRSNALKRKEEASPKIQLLNGLIFGVVLALVMVPMFMNLAF